MFLLLKLYLLPYISGIVTYVILKILQRQGKLRRFDKYLWSPFVFSFAGVSLILITIFNLQYHNFSSVTSLLEFIMFISFHSQLLWVSAMFQFFAIFYKKQILLKISQAFIWISILLLLSVTVIFLLYA